MDLQTQICKALKDLSKKTEDQALTLSTLALMIPQLDMVGSSTAKELKGSSEILLKILNTSHDPALQVTTCMPVTPAYPTPCQQTVYTVMLIF
jgi:hypothetical protein